MRNSRSSGGRIRSRGGRGEVPPVVAILLALGLAAPLAAGSPELQVRKIDDQVIVVHGGGGNVTAVRTDAGILVTDSFVTPREGLEARKLIEAHFPALPIRYLINTHHHFDHIAGNQHFRDAVIIGHVNIVRRMAEERAEIFGENAGGGTRPADLEDYRPTEPGLLISADTLIHLGGKTFEILHFGPAHTDNDLVILDREDRLLIMGDLLCPGKSYILGPGSDARGWIALLDKLIDRSGEYDHVVAGHGAVVVDVSALGWQRQYLADLWDAVTGAHGRGLTLEQAKREIDLGKYRDNIQYDKIGFDIEECWSQLTGMRPSE